MHTGGWMLVLIFFENWLLTFKIVRFYLKLRFWLLLKRLKVWEACVSFFFSFSLSLFSSLWKLVFHKLLLYYARGSSLFYIVFLHAFCKVVLIIVPGKKNLLGNSTVAKVFKTSLFWKADIIFKLWLLIDFKMLPSGTCSSSKRFLKHGRMRQFMPFESPESRIRSVGLWVFSAGLEAASDGV